MNGKSATNSPRCAWTFEFRFALRSSSARAIDAALSLKGLQERAAVGILRGGWKLAQGLQRLFEQLGHTDNMRLRPIQPQRGLDHRPRLW